jgi:hypothetical protein
MESTQFLVFQVCTQSSITAASQRLELKELFRVTNKALDLWQMDMRASRENLVSVCWYLALEY